MKLLLGQSQFALRKCKLRNRTLNAGQLKGLEIEITSWLVSAYDFYSRVDYYK
jgi:hypothetical protein